MEEKIKELRAAIEQASADVTDKARLSDFWQKYLSKNCLLYTSPSPRD